MMRSWLAANFLPIHHLQQHQTCMASISTASNSSGDARLAGTPPDVLMRCSRRQARAQAAAAKSPVVYDEAWRTRIRCSKKNACRWPCGLVRHSLWGLPNNKA